MEIIRKRIRFLGYVQGVGFRYKACYAARSLNITGWVENCNDGSVELEAEGTREAIGELVEKLCAHTWGHVDEIRSENIPLQHDYGFEIR